MLGNDKNCRKRVKQGGTDSNHLFDFLRTGHLHFPRAFHSMLQVLVLLTGNYAHVFARSGRFHASSTPGADAYSSWQCSHLLLEVAMLSN